MSESVSISNHCPRCGQTAAELAPVDAGLRLALQTTMDASQLPSQVCRSCHGELTGEVSQGMKLRMEQAAREKNRAMMWKSRVNLIKQARQLMTMKAYSEAAVNYEKYLRVLEVSFDVKPGELKPEIFGRSERSKELTVIATVYWDLLRIYDTSPSYRDRMSIAAKKLSEFLPFSPIYPNVIQQAQSYVNSCKNPDIVKNFLRESKALKGRCFIATAVYNEPLHPDLELLRQFRDQHLIPRTAGLKFVFFYYKQGPAWAQSLQRHAGLRASIRLLIKSFVFFLRFFLKSKQN